MATLYERGVSISNNDTTDLADFQTKILITDGTDPIFDKAASDGSDIRFRDSNENLLDHWVEHYDATNGICRIWVKAPLIPASGSTTITLQYGDGSNVKASDPSATFLRFDDFTNGLTNYTLDSNTSAGVTEITSSNNLHIDIGREGFSERKGRAATWTASTLSAPYTMGVRMRNARADNATSQDNNNTVEAHTPTANAVSDDGVRGQYKDSTTAADLFVQDNYSGNSNTANYGSIAAENWYQCEIKAGSGWVAHYVETRDGSKSGISSVSANLNTSGQYPASFEAYAGYHGHSNMYYAYWYCREFAQNEPTVSIGSETAILDAPTNVTATVNNNASIDVTWADNTTDEDNYHVQISRDGAGYVDPSGGPATPGANTTSANYNPSSDSAYDSQVGIDSSFRFRVRAENANGTSDWAYTGTKYTTPVPPKNPRASRPDANSIDISWEVGTDLGSNIRVDIEYRKDTGSGWSGWDNAETTGSLSKGTTMTRSYSVANDAFMEKDARYQFRIAHYHYQDWNNDGNRTLHESPYVYTDYGNANDVFFEDGFESSDLSNWDATSLGDGNSGVTSGTGNADFNISGADSGTYWCRLDAEDYIQKNLGDLSGESNVYVRCAFVVGSLDSGAENFSVWWYDGSAWQELQSLHWEYNRQGWVEVHADVPSSYLATDNRVKIQAGSGFTAYGGDHCGVDRVIVSDILNEYTQPAASTNLTTDANIGREIRLDWTLNSTINNAQFTQLREAGGSSWTNANNWGAGYPTGTTAQANTIGDLNDGEQYEFRNRVRVTQHRYGQFETHYWANTGVVTDTTLIYHLTGTTTSVTGDDITGSWTVNSNAEDGVRFYYGAADNMLTNPSFEDDAIGTTNPTGWTYPLHDQGVPAWSVTDDKAAYIGSKCFGSLYSGANADGGGNSAQTYEDGAYIYQRIGVGGGETLLATAWGRPWGGARSPYNNGEEVRNYVGEDDVRLRVRSLDGTGTVLAEDVTPWGASLGYDSAWGAHTLLHHVDANAAEVEFRVEGGDGNDGFDNGKGGNAGVRIDHCQLYEVTQNGQDLAADTTSDTVANLLDGERYVVVPTVFTEHGTVADKGQ